MKKRFILLTFIALLAACSIEVSDSPTPTAVQPTESAPTEESSPIPADTPAGEGEEAETPAATGPATEEAVEPTDTPAATLAPPPWADFNLSGTLVYIAFVGEQQNLLRLDLVTGEETTLFDPPDEAWLSDVAVSPDGNQLVLTYAPPPPEGQTQFGFTDLYLMPADGSAEPRPLLLRSAPSETYFNVSWPTDEHIYYAHLTPRTLDDGTIMYVSQVERVQVAENEVEVIAEAAAWPRVSSDGSRLAYVTDENELTVADADGADPQVILDPAFFPAVDAPVFSPDNSLLYFSAIEPEPASSFSLWDWLMGVKVAYAHTVPSDWWRIPADGSGTPERLTNIYEIGMYGDFGPEGRYLAFITTQGVQIMNPDGTGLFRLRSIAATGTLNWVYDR
ncbi:MAG: hypothetical protein L0332_01330 [Chloroflexi bacterium]|nr:hypothetical protein [Chloroflexota bacterium]MCI0577418.1 hypothetical protein [Chloroflexota bacterium]MCI0649596.1 hypothetical protein [Chloroflexota bacterium]MCI0725364.1 hypothetical protein [Chloroflexota bacterium]